MFIQLKVALNCTFLFVSNLNYAKNVYLSFYFADEILYKETKPFFENNHIVIDDVEVNSPFYNHLNKHQNSCEIVDSSDGSLNVIHNIIDSSQYTFVYMYANWCARSRALRNLMQNLACIHSKEVKILLYLIFS